VRVGSGPRAQGVVPKWSSTALYLPDLDLAHFPLRHEALM
jgi:hypothetical protein